MRPKAARRKAAALEWARMASRNPDLGEAQARRFTCREWPELLPAFAGEPCAGSVVLGLDKDHDKYWVEDPKNPSEWRG